jgi:hypothetical protein
LREDGSACLLEEKGHPYSLRSQLTIAITFSDFVGDTAKAYPAVAPNNTDKDKN